MDHVVPQVGGVNPQKVNADTVTRANAANNCFYSEKRHDDMSCEQAWNDQIVHRMRRESAQGVDLFGYLHRAERGGNRRANATCNHQPCQYWAELTAHGYAHDGER